METLKIKLLTENSKLPTRANPTDAGLDLHSIEKLALLPRTRKLIRTGISIEIPEGYYGRVAPRSGLAFKSGIEVFAGVIDSSYRGELCVILYNSDNSTPLLISEGDRIAQLIIEKHYNLPIEEVSQLNSTERGSGGFGSSGT
jgi:dUTP pyrophosphatase